MDCNEVFNKIYREYNENKLSHIFLIVTNNIDNAYIDIIKLIKKISCPFKYEENCTNKCNICRQIDNNEMSDIILIESENNMIKKESVKNLISEFTIKAKYLKNKFYIILNAENMNRSSDNSLLKFIEEPEENIIGFLVTTDKNKILPTILSRCEIINVYYNSEQVVLEEDLQKEIDEIVVKTTNYIGNKSISEFLIFKQNIIKLFNSKEIINYYFSSLLKYYSNLIKDNNNENDLSKLVNIVKIIDNISRWANNNVNIDLIFDKFFIEMVNIYE